jgi:hypothetical protein
LRAGGLDEEFAEGGGPGVVVEVGCVDQSAGLRRELVVLTGRREKGGCTWCEISLTISGSL